MRRNYKTLANSPPRYEPNYNNLTNSPPRYDPEGMQRERREKKKWYSASYENSCFGLMKDLFPLVLITIGYFVAILITCYLTPGNDLHEGRDTEERFRRGISDEVRKDADRMWRNFGMRSKPKEKKNENLLDPNREIKDMEWKIRKQRMEDPWANLFGSSNDPWDDKKETDHVDWLKKMFPDFYGADEVAEEKAIEGNQAASNQESNVNQESQQQRLRSQETNQSQQQNAENQPQRGQNASQNRDSQQTQNSNQYQGYQQQGQNAGNQQQEERAYSQQNQGYQQQGQNQGYEQQRQDQAYQQGQNQAQQQGQNQRYQQNQQYQQEQQGYQQAQDRNYQGNQQRVPPGYDRQPGGNQPQGNQRSQNQQYDTRKL